MSEKLITIIQGYMQHTHGGEVDEVGDAMRDEMEDEIRREGHTLFYGGNPIGEQLKPAVGKILKDAKSKKHEKSRVAARGMNG